MRPLAALRILAALGVAALASGAAAVTEREVFVVTGIFKYERGDTISYKCPQGVCRDTLIRDRYLQEHGAELFGKDITVRVRRIDACRDPRSTQLACQTRLKETALLIVEWVRPRDGARQPGG
jgi:hypothetical protein